MRNNLSLPSHEVPFVSLILRLWFIFGTEKMTGDWTGGGGCCEACEAADVAEDSESEAIDRDVGR